MKHIRNTKDHGIWFCPKKQTEVTGPKLVNMDTIIAPDMNRPKANNLIFNRTWGEISNLQLKLSV